MILFPPAKINLGLNVLEKRPDGYHEIETCMHVTGLCDVLEILPAAELKFIQTGIAVAGNSEDNLVMRAWQLLHDRYDIAPMYMHLQKHIPMGAGLGGGSADATYALLGLNSLCDLGLSAEQLQQLASELGSDCPFFVKNVPQLATGRGEVLAPISLNLQGYYLKLINPGIHIGTAEAYAGVIFSDSQDLASELLRPIAEWKDVISNGFEVSVVAMHPTIGDLIDDLYSEGAIYASMSGSGSTVYGIFEQMPSQNAEHYTHISRF